jgi:hypothetical protein
MAAITCIVKISNINRISSSISAIQPLRRKLGYRHLEDVVGLREEYSIVTSMNFMSHSLQIC